MNDLLSVVAKIAAMDDAVAKVARLSASAFSPKNDDKAMAIRHAAEHAEESAGKACIAYVRTLAQPVAVGERSADYIRGWNDRAYRMQAEVAEALADATRPAVPDGFGADFIRSIEP